MCLQWKHEHIQMATTSCCIQCDTSFLSIYVDPFPTQCKWYANHS